MKEEKNRTGWNAITDTFLKLYPGQTEPIHFASLLSYSLGGEPLDGISVYDGGDYYHFVSYGLSELYEKEFENMEYSGYGFEFTMKLKKSSLKNVEKELQCVCSIFQALAGEAFSSGSVFQPYEYIYTGQTQGMDSEGASDITGFVTVPDEAGEIETPNGKVQFVQLVGMTNAEFELIFQEQKTIQELVAQLGHTMTDYQRESLVG